MHKGLHLLISRRQTDPSESLQQETSCLVMYIWRRKVRLYFGVVERRAARRLFADV